VGFPINDNLLLVSVCITETSNATAPQGRGAQYANRDDRYRNITACLWFPSARI